MAQLAAEIARLNAALGPLQQIGLATGLLAHRFAFIPEWGWSAAEDKAGENSGAANSELGIVKGQLWPVIRA
jgi:hypothetical protein